jgi:type I restriction enzyme R subunit
MSTKLITESVLEEAVLAWFETLGYKALFGPDVAPGELHALRSDYPEVILRQKLFDAIANINPDINPQTQQEAIRKVLLADSPSLVINNRNFHKILIEGVPVEIQREDGSTGYEYVKLIDFENPERNDFLVINQFTVKQADNVRRPDVVVFINGLPIVVIELKNPADEEATIWTAFNQLETYKDQISSLFNYNEILVISDGLAARLGSITANQEWFLPWRTIEGEKKALTSQIELEVLIKGVFDKKRLLDYIRYAIVFDDDGSSIAKILAGYHQYHAVNKAVETTVEAASPEGDKRCGVVWHTQGAGKSLTMAFYAGKIIQHPALRNPTIVVITDRNDLDDQLFGTFSRCSELLRQKPVQAESRNQLREYLNVASGRVIFTTIQKFLPFEDEDKHPKLNDRSNIIVIADEAHRSQYDFIDGYARYMREALPNASFIGFTGTPLELEDKNTRHVFGDHISIYDIQQAVIDKATVPIYYESRLAKLGLNEKELPRIDAEFEEVTEGEEVEHKEKLKTKWAAQEALVGSEKRINLIAEDLVRHFEDRLSVMEGKGMVVCMSRRICVELYNAITRLRPQWHDPADDKGQIKIVMTGKIGADPANWQQHIRNKPKREFLAKRFKNPKDPFKLVIVRDMWLTGFDVPCLHTMYIDKPMKGHTLMQAIARVNRVYGNKPGGLIVDYLGLAPQLKYAMQVYTESGGQGKTAINQEEAVEVMLEKYEVCLAMFHGFDFSTWTKGRPEARLALLPPAQDYVLNQKDGKSRFIQAVTELSKAFALAVPHEKAIEICDDVSFFQTVKAGLVKLLPEEEDKKVRTPEEIELAIRQIISKAITPDKVIDVFAAAGLQKPDISILSDEFLEEVRGMKFKNLAVELLQKLLHDEIKTRSRTNLVQSRSFKEMLEKTIRAYQNRSIETAQVIEELIGLAKQMRDAHKKGEDLGLTTEELAFYDALGVNDSAVKVLGDQTLKFIAQELVKMIHNNLTIDWSVKESVRARLRVLVRRILNKYGYPPDKQESATQTVLEQAELLCRDWAA